MVKHTAHNGRVKGSSPFKSIQVSFGEMSSNGKTLVFDASYYWFESIHFRILIKFCLCCILINKIC